MPALKTNSRTGEKKKKSKEGGNLPEWGIDFVWPKRVLHSWSRQQEGCESCCTNRRAKAPMQNYFLTAPGKITHFCAPFFFLIFTDDTILSTHSSPGAPHGHFTDLKLQRCNVPSFAMQADHYVKFTVKASSYGKRDDFPQEAHMSNGTFFSTTIHTVCRTCLH